LTRQLIIIHGTGGEPNENWFPWLASKAREAGCEVVVPQFPTPDGQTPSSWLTHLDNAVGSLGPKTTLVGHSLGCALILRALERPGERIEASIFASGFIGELNNPDFDPLNAPFFVDAFDWTTISQRAGAVEVFNGDDDPYVPLEKGRELASLLNAEPTVISKGGHLNTAAGFAEFPQLWEKLQAIWATHTY
jgi:predicted alpha/beta hydrolase family esterase